MIDFLKYPKIGHLGTQEVKDLNSDANDLVVIQEKIDGANFRFIMKDGKLIFGSRNTEGIEGGKYWGRCIKYVSDKVLSSPIDLSLLEGYIFYGECMIRHTIDYDWINTPPFIGFDIWHISDGVFLNDVVCRESFHMLGLESVPLIGVFKAGEIPIYSDDTLPKSKYYAGTVEGVVYKNYSKQVFAKYVSSKFKESNKLSFGSSKKYAKDDTEYIVLSYCTNPRIDKQIFRLIEEGEELSLGLMSKLVDMVINDLFEEHWRDIVFNKRKLVVDFGALKKMVGKRCFEVLKQMITNNQINHIYATS